MSTNRDRALQWIAEHLVRMCHHIPDFMWGGEQDLGVHWAFTATVCRDEPKADHTRWWRTTAVMKKRYPDDVDDVRNRHWGFGWVDQLLVRMLDDEWKVTKAGIDIIERMARKFTENDVEELAFLIEEAHGALENPRLAPASLFMEMQGA